MRRQRRVKIAGPAVAAAALATLVMGCGSRTTPAAVRDSSVIPAISATAAPASVAPLNLASPAIPTKDSEQARQAEAAEIARELVASVTLPAGAVKVTKPPAPDLTAAPSTEETQRMATAYALFTMPSTISAATVADFVEAHLPPGLTRTGDGSAGGLNLELDYVTFEGAPTDAFESPQLLVTTEQAGPLTGVRIDAQVVWLPVRTAAETVPTTVSGGTITYSAGAAPRTITITAVDARRLASILNELPTMSDGTHNCPAQIAGITVTFETKPTVVVAVDDCGSEVDVSAGGVDQPALGDSGALVAAASALLGLPANSPAN